MSMQMRLTSLDILLLPMMLTSSGNGDSGFRHVVNEQFLYEILSLIVRSFDDGNINLAHII